MVDLLQVECLEAVVRTGSFRAAAREVHLSQPAVSAHVTKLERELGLQLLFRAPDGSKVTSQGELVLPHLRAFVASAESVRRATEFIRASEQQTLRVMSYRTGLTQILPEAFRVLNDSFGPLAVRMLQATPDEIVAELLRGACDIGLSVRYGDIPAVPELTSEVLLDLGPPVLCGPHGHPLLEHAQPISLTELGDYPLVIQRDHESFLIPLLPKVARRRLTVVEDTQVILAMLDRGAELVITGIGPQLLRNTAIARREIIEAPEVTVVLTTTSVAELSPPAAALWDFLISWGEFQRRNLARGPDRGPYLIDPSQPAAMLDAISKV